MATLLSDPQSSTMTLDAFRHRLVGNRLQAFLDILLNVIYRDDD